MGSIWEFWKKGGGTGGKIETQGAGAFQQMKLKRMTKTMQKQKKKDPRRTDGKRGEENNKNC